MTRSSYNFLIINHISSTLVSCHQYLPSPRILWQLDYSKLLWVMGGVKVSETRNYLPKLHFFCHFYHVNHFSDLIISWGGNKRTKQRLKHFLGIINSPNNIFWVIIDPSHNLGLNPRKSLFLKNVICCFFTWKFNLDILT